MQEDIAVEGASYRCSAVVKPLAVGMRTLNTLLPVLRAGGGEYVCLMRKSRALNATFQVFEGIRVHLLSSLRTGTHLVASTPSPSTMEDSGESFKDPLRLDLKGQAQKLDQLPLEHSAALKNATSRVALLDLLSALLLMPQYTMTVATLYRPVLMDLCARWLHQDSEILLKFEALCLLLEIHSELYPYVIIMASLSSQMLVYGRDLLLFEASHY